jgi:hypothetical protein
MGAGRWSDGWRVSYDRERYEMLRREFSDVPIPFYKGQKVQEHGLTGRPFGL